MNASFFTRFKAFLIDYVFICAYLALLFVVNMFLFPDLQKLFQGSLIQAQFAGFLMVTLPVSIYFILSDSAFGGQSFGKRKLGIRTVTRNGKSVSVPQAVLRTVFKFLPWEMSHYLVYRLVYLDAADIVPFHYYVIGGLIYILMFAYILTAIFTRKKQALYDTLARTLVVKL